MGATSLRDTTASRSKGNGTCALLLSAALAAGCRPGPVESRAPRLDFRAHESWLSARGTPLGAIPKGSARLLLSVRNGVSSPGFEAREQFLLPFDCSWTQFRYGPRAPIQTIVNNSVATTQVDLGLHVKARVCAVRLASGTSAARLELDLDDAHTLQQIGLPFRIAELPVLDVSAVRAQWLLEAGRERRLYAWDQARGQQSWELKGLLEWDAGSYPDQAEAAPAGLCRVDLRLAFCRSGDRNVEELHEASFDTLAFSTGQDRQGWVRPTRFGHGLRLPSETNANQTRFVTYEDWMTGYAFELHAGAGPGHEQLALEYTRARLVDLPDATKPVPPLAHVHTGTLRARPAQLSAPLVLGSVSDGVDPEILSVVLESFSLTTVEKPTP